MVLYLLTVRIPDLITYPALKSLLLLWFPTAIFVLILVNLLLVGTPPFCLHRHLNNHCCRFRLLLRRAYNVFHTIASMESIGIGLW